MKRAYHKIFLIGIVLAVFLNGCGGENREDTTESRKGTEESSVQKTAEASTQEEASIQGEASIQVGASIQEDAPTQEEALQQEETNGDSQIIFTCQDMDGNAVSEAVFSESKLTMVNVWATYCNPCLSEMPGLGELSSEYEPGEFQIIGIISDVMEGADAATMDNAAALIEMTGANYTHLLLNESVFYALLTEVTAVPTIFFVNENGEVVDTVIGAMEKSAWEGKINALLEDS